MKTVSRPITLLLFLLLPLLAAAQEMSVKDFYLAQTDLTANTRGTMVYDQNGEICALIKLETTIDGFTFDVGSLGVTDTKRVGGELWIYVPFGIRRISLSHPQLGIVEYRFPVPIEKARTYVMKLNAKLGQRQYDNSKKQKLIVDISPADATFEINNFAMALNPLGHLEQELAFGTYDIVISHPNYHSVTMTQDINDEVNPHHLEVKLKQNYGWLAIPMWDGEAVYLDDNLQPFQFGDHLMVRSGHYRLRLKKPLYKAYETDIEIQDSVQTDVNFDAWEYNAKQMTLTAPENVAIYLDSLRMGDSNVYEGLVEYGSYMLTGRRRGYRSSVRPITISPDSPDSFTLEAPTPAFGTLYVTTDPTAAQVYVDDEFMGETPGTFTLPVDDHKVAIRKQGKDTEFFDIMILEAEADTLNVKMQSTLTVKIDTDQPGARLSIDGVEVGETPFETRIEAGEHEVIAIQDGWRKFKKVINFDNPRTYQLKQSPKYSRKGAAYFNFDYATGPSTFVGGAFGFYGKKFNMEFNGLYGLKSSENIYWNSSGGTSEPTVFTYTPIVAGARMGFEIPLNRFIGFTFRVGGNYIIARGTALSTVNYNASQCSAASAVGDVRVAFRIAKPLLVTVVPEYQYPLYRSNLYSAIANQSTTFKAWDSGFRVRLGLCLIF